MPLEDRVATHSEFQRKNAPFSDGYAVAGMVAGSLVVALWLALSHTLFAPDPLDVTAAQKTLASFANPIIGSLAGDETIYRDCPDAGCATVTRSFRAPAGLTLGQAVDQLNQWGIANSYATFDKQLSCTSGAGQNAVGAPVGQCTVTIQDANSETPVTLGFQFADPGYPDGDGPWFANAQLPVISIVASIDTYALGHD